MELRKDSDIDTFEEIVGRYSDRLFRFAFMRIGVREPAEDIVQEVFIRLFNSLHSGKEIRNIETFLFRSISNACIDFFRRNRQTPLDIEELADIPAETDRDIEVEYHRIKVLLEGLPPEQAEILRLKCYDELTFRRISEIFNLPEATVKSRYRYAIQSIRKKLEN